MTPDAGTWVILFAGVIAGYAYVGYPVLLWLLGLARPRRLKPGPPDPWPTVSVTIPVYNERGSICSVLERALKFDYPRDRIQILVISDSSTDGTDDIVREFSVQGVELIRLPKRGGKTAAENAALPHLRGEIIVNTDASIRIPADALKKMLVWFGDPSVGVVSGRDISVTNVGDDANVAESGYVGYEMWIRQLETKVDGIIGASGCFYAIRRYLHEELVPEALSRDFAAPLVARERGYRSVSAHEAVCFVPRTPSLEKEYQRKVRTMTRGLETLFYKRRLLNPFRYAWFAWMLWSHKVIRWLVPWALAGVVMASALIFLGGGAGWWRWLVVGELVLGTAGVLGWRWARLAETVPLLRAPAYVVAGLTASLHAWIKALQGELNPLWEPTRREG